MFQITYKAAWMKMTKPKVVSEPITSASPTVQTCRIGSGATKTVAPAIGARQWLTPIQSRGCAVGKVRMRSSGFRVRSLEVRVSARVQFRLESSDTYLSWPCWACFLGAGWNFMQGLQTCGPCYSSCHASFCSQCVLGVAFPYPLWTLLSGLCLHPIGSSRAQRRPLTYACAQP